MSFKFFVLRYAGITDLAGKISLTTWLDSSLLKLFVILLFEVAFVFNEASDCIRPLRLSVGLEEFFS